MEHSICQENNFCMLRSPLRPSTLRMVNLPVPLHADSGCIIAFAIPLETITCTMCLENNFALIMASGKWTTEKDAFKRG